MLVKVKWGRTGSDHELENVYIFIGSAQIQRSCSARRQCVRGRRRAGATHLVVPAKGVLEQDLTPPLDVDRLVCRLLSELRDLVFLEGLLEQFGEGLDCLLKVAAK